MATAKPSPVANYERLMAFKGGEDLSGAEYTFGEITATGVKKVSTAGGDAQCIIVKGSKTVGDTVEVLTEYGTRMLIKLGTTSAAIPTGTKIKVDANGAALPATGTDADGTTYHGVVVGDGISGTNAKAGKFVDIIFMPNFDSKS